jgi:predicted metal-dependent phosphotriesterase family hydrolase
MVRTDVEVMTVLGPTMVGELGVTLSHEHVLLNLILEYKREEVLNDEPLAIQELGWLPEVGCRTIFDPTSLELDSDPEALKRVSAATARHDRDGPWALPRPLHPR